MLKRILKVVAAALALVIAVFTIWEVYGFYTHDPDVHYAACGEVVPVSVPFAVQYGGYVLTCDVVIEKEDVYAISLKYYHAKNIPSELERVRELAGGKAGGVGGPMSIQYRVMSLDTGDIIKEGNNNALKLTSHETGSATAMIVGLGLVPGRYQIKVESLKDVPEMALIKTDLKVMASYYK